MRRLLLILLYAIYIACLYSICYLLPGGTEMAAGIDLASANSHLPHHQISAPLTYPIHHKL